MRWGPQGLVSNSMTLRGHIGGLGLGFGLEVALAFASKCSTWSCPWLWLQHIPGWSTKNRSVGHSEWGRGRGYRSLCLWLRQLTMYKCTDSGTINRFVLWLAYLRVGQASRQQAAVKLSRTGVISVVKDCYFELEMPS